eukprot:2378314-Pleurochrysis_carterae.AAC.5
MHAHNIFASKCSLTAAKALPCCHTCVFCRLAEGISNSVWFFGSKQRHFIGKFVDGQPISGEGASSAKRDSDASPYARAHLCVRAAQCSCMHGRNRAYTTVRTSCLCCHGVQHASELLLLFRTNVLSIPRAVRANGCKRSAATIDVEAVVT